ncbi:MAG: hypothetical protein NZM25_01120 [Leptospiraceae bacterium]|nr:hypothetical protein [Leptospiraceae bacterium]
MQKSFPIKTLVFFLFISSLAMVAYVLENIMLIREYLAYAAHKPIKISFSRAEIKSDILLVDKPLIKADIYGAPLNEIAKVLLVFPNNYWQGAVARRYAHIAEFFRRAHGKNTLIMILHLPRQWGIIGQSLGLRQNYLPLEKEAMEKLSFALPHFLQAYLKKAVEIHILSINSGVTAALNFLLSYPDKISTFLMWQPVLPKRDIHERFDRYFVHSYGISLPQQQESIYSEWQQALRKVKKLGILAPKKDAFLLEHPSLFIEETSSSAVAIFRLGRGEELDEKILKFWDNKLY